MASDHTSAGYAVERGTFRSRSPPLLALDDGEAGVGNGVYRYGAHGFPNLRDRAWSHWVEPVFRSSARTIAEGSTPVAAWVLP